MPRDIEGTLERLFEVATLLADSMDGGLEEQGLSRARAEVLWRVHHGGPQTQRDLALALQCTPRNVTGLVDGLVEQGLVERTPHPTDGRAVLIRLTAAGEQTVDAWQSSYRGLGAELLGDVRAQDLATFRAVLDRVRERLRSVQRAAGEAT